jgi:hypothetical protein
VGWPFLVPGIPRKRATDRGFDNARMPELPEVEVTRRSLAGPLEGAMLLRVWQGKALRWPLGVSPSVLAGRRIGALQRRGKYLWMPLEPASAGGEIRAEPSPGLLLHLGMSGSLDLFSSAAVAPRRLHDHFEWITDRGVLRLHDPRRFGAVVWSVSLDLPPAAGLLAGLGVEPLEPGFTAARLRAGLAGRRVSVKQALLAGDVVVGVGKAGGGLRRRVLARQVRADQRHLLRRHRPPHAAGHARAHHHVPGGTGAGTRTTSTAAAVAAADRDPPGGCRR